MERKTSRLLSSAIFLSVLLMGCDQQAQKELDQKAPPVAEATVTVTNEQATSMMTEQSSSATSDHLAQALTFAPGDTTEFSFLDWEAFREYKGATALDSKSSDKERNQFFRDLGFDQPLIPQGVWSLSPLEDFRNAWSWDATDLVWDATITRGDKEPISVIKFRSNFDVTPILARFSSGGFVENQYNDITVYSHVTDGSSSKYLDAALFNTAVLSDQNIFVLSWDTLGVHAALNTYARPSGASSINQQVGSISEHLGPQMAVLIQIGAGACPFPGPTVKVQSQADNDKLAEKASRVHSYSSLVAGIRYQGADKLGTVVFHYTDTVPAQMDFQTRSDEVANGKMLFLEKDAPINKRLRLDKAEVLGNDIILHVRPSSTSVFYSMIMEHDMTFATCP